MDRAIFAKLGLKARVRGTRRQPAHEDAYCKAERNKEGDEGGIQWSM